MIVLDTNVISEVMRPRPEARVQAWLDGQSIDTLYVSSITVAELLFGVGALPVGARKDRLRKAADGLLALFAGRVLAFDQESARRYAEIAVDARRLGRSLAVADGYIAAIAASRSFAVATRNVSDFEYAGVEIINPWD
ncbi:type II toxin-antitoxin system VapC family toxin [Propionimicrobium sp. PCR01-08-3]|uniref:type II toxin-antitoxin system VapC family toxin n=1 Tax=Propionimicrobium sp. PCR01-08-3 TaxID=3052086 RepID=UPI00255CFD80|nr:type II toxin-antitoxin system VapC family toxin [Propionimicrobium sp. PCR01-08-3]WIY82362.1 type II toxin-antitoxin system VapC family toxin [Propionimicrobium sp. PCR01-08-3]